MHSFNGSLLVIYQSLPKSDRGARFKEYQKDGNSVFKFKTRSMKEFNSINEILEFAIGEEQAAVDFYLQMADLSKNQQTRKIFMEYTALAGRASDPTIKSLFEMLALEESKHKLAFEIEYDEYILKEN
jgi:rubrerythrin